MRDVKHKRQNGALRNIIFISTLLVLTFCKKNESSYQQFLGKDKEEEKVESADGAVEESGDKKDNKSASISDKDRVVVTASEWEQVQDKVRKCSAELGTVKSEVELLEKASFAKGEASCKEKSIKSRDEIAKEIMGEVDTVIDEIRTQLLKYRFTSAIVNGECQALMNDGKKRNVIIRDNLCVNVVHKKVGNDGELSGLIEAVSAEAVKDGVVSLNCDIGKAHIALLSKKCDAKPGSGASAGKIDIKN